MAIVIAGTRLPHLVTGSAECPQNVLVVPDWNCAECVKNRPDRNADAPQIC